MIDIHSHILPGIDDGSKSWEMTLEMCRMAKADGVSHIFATPHANYEYTYDRQAHAALVEELRGRFPDLGFTIGGEMHLSFDNVQTALRNPEYFALGQSRYVLVELPEYGNFKLMHTLFDLQSAGLIPIIAHPERNPMVLSKPDSVQQFCDAGCLTQLTANSLTGFWGRETQKFSEKLLKKGLVHFIASDAHSLRSRPPLLADAARVAARIVGPEAAKAMVSGNGQAVLAAQYTIT